MAAAETGWAEREPPGKLQVGSLGTSSSEQTPGFALPSAAGQAEVVKSAKEKLGGCGEELWESADL